MFNMNNILNRNNVNTGYDINQGPEQLYSGLLQSYGLQPQQIGAFSMFRNQVPTVAISGANTGTIGNLTQQAGVGLNQLPKTSLGTTSLGTTTKPSLGINGYMGLASGAFNLSNILNRNNVNTGYNINQGADQLYSGLLSSYGLQPQQGGAFSMFRNQVPTITIPGANTGNISNITQQAGTGLSQLAKNSLVQPSKPGIGTTPKPGIGVNGYMGLASGAFNLGTQVANNLSVPKIQQQDFSANSKGVLQNMASNFHGYDVGRTSNLGNTASGALSGASAGMAFGPVGAGVGAAIGGVGSLVGSIFGNSARKRAEEKANKIAWEDMNSQNTMLN